MQAVIVSGAAEEIAALAWAVQERRRQDPVMVVCKPAQRTDREVASLCYISRWPKMS